MARIFPLTVGIAFLLLASVAVGAETAPIRLDLARVISLAATNAPEARLAQSRVAEEEAKLSSADVRTKDDPRLEAAVGPRSGSETTADLDLGLEIPLEFGLRAKRVALAEAGIVRQRHAADNASREVVLAAVTAYYAVLQAQERLRLMQERKAVAQELLRVAEERYRSGDGPRFEVNVAQAELARGTSEITSAQGRLASQRGVLAQRIGFSSQDAMLVQGELKDRGVFDSLRSGPAPADRADLLAALAEVEAASRAVSLARAEQAPDWALRLNYRREGDENIAMAGVSVTLPFLNRKAGPLREARAAEDRAKVAVAARKAAIAAEVEAARRAYDAASQAVRQMEAEALPVQRETESMATESYRSGKIPLAALLLVRRDALETRKEYLEQLMEAAEAGVALASALGHIPRTK